MPRLWAKTVSFESVKEGDTLPILVKWETSQTIERFTRLLAPEPTANDGEDLPESPESPEINLLPASPAPGSALVAYVTELLEKAFPVTSILSRGSRLEFEIVRPVEAEDTITLTGQVVGKREEAGLRLVEAEVVMENQHQQLVARAIATLAL